MTEQQIKNRETMIMENGPKKDLHEFRYVGTRLGYKYIVCAFAKLKKVEVAALCRDRDELTETLLMFSERGLCCAVDKIDATDLFDLELN